MNTWSQTVDKISPYIVRVSTPRGSGTGFLISINKNTGLCAVATAAHVIQHAHNWQEPIRLDHHSSGRSSLVTHSDRAIQIHQANDIAAIVIARGDIPFPDQLLALPPQDKTLRVGNEIGWLGFPAVSPENLCFFGGRVSAFIESGEAYLVDGVTINGVSGGPAFHPSGESFTVMGIVSAYLPNRSTPNGEVLPGLGVIRSVNKFHGLTKAFASVGQAKEGETPPSDSRPSTPENVSTLTSAMTECK